MVAARTVFRYMRMNRFYLPFAKLRPFRACESIHRTLRKSGLACGGVCSGERRSSEFPFRAYKFMIPRHLPKPLSVSHRAIQSFGPLCSGDNPPSYKFEIVPRHAYYFSKLFHKPTCTTSLSQYFASVSIARLVSLRETSDSSSFPALLKITKVQVALAEVGYLMKLRDVQD